jgi:uncharacterized SAM-binding protein YcdF (DUF218 family)
MAWLLSPLAWLLVAMLLLPFAWWHRRRRWLMAAVIAVAIVAVAAMTPLGANLLVAPLERPLPMPPGCDRPTPTTAVVLGGGIEGWPRTDADFSALNLSSRRRLDRAIAWFREREGRVLVMQGGEPYPGSGSLAGLMAAYAQAHGVPASALRVEPLSGDTWGNAQHAARLSPPLDERIVLVTSRIHVPRAHWAYARAGFDVCTLGADSRRLPSRLPWAIVPRTSGLANAEAALHEWVGLAYYRWRHRDAVAAPGR